MHLDKALSKGVIVALQAGSFFLAGCSAQDLARVSPAPGRDLYLSYAMEQADGERIPYRVYVPSDWEERTERSMVLILHGYAGNANGPFDDADGLLQAEAEEHGFLVASPNGYNGMADYGANLPLPPRELSRFNRPLEMEPSKESALAEADVLNVLGSVVQEFDVDPSRLFLMGNSMGMTGTLHFARTMPETWCAISPSGGPPWPDYPVERLRPIAGALFVHGGRDEIADAADTRGLAERARAAGINAHMHLVPEGTHGDAWIRYLPETFDFFARIDCDNRQARSCCR